MGGNAILGKTSLWTSLAGIVLPICLAVLATVFVDDRKKLDPCMNLCGLLFVLLEVAALGCGLGAIGTAAGKGGLAIAGGLLLLIGIAFTVYLTSPI